MQLVPGIISKADVSGGRGVVEVVLTVNGGVGVATDGAARGRGATVPPPTRRIVKVPPSQLLQDCEPGGTQGTDGRTLRPLPQCAAVAGASVYMRLPHADVRAGEDGDAAAAAACAAGEGGPDVHCERDPGGETEAQALAVRRGQLRRFEGEGHSDCAATH
jgi:hypothetical protein